MDDDMTFDDGFDDLPVSEPDAIEPDPTDLEPEEVEEPTSEPTEPVEEPETPQERMLRLKVDRGEKEVPESEAILLAQKGLNYERAVERAKQEARDSYIKEQGYTWQDKPITTEAEYKQAIAEQDMLKKYQDTLPQEVIDDLIEARRDREERKKEKQERAEAEQKAAEEAQQQQQYNDFFQVFEEANDRKFDPKTDVLPQEVIDAANKGVPLQYAYMKYHNKQLKISLKTKNQNETNQKKAPIGSVTSNGSVDTGKEDDWFSKGEDKY